MMTAQERCDYILNELLNLDAQTREPVIAKEIHAARQALIRVQYILKVGDALEAVRSQAVEQKEET
jgi:hypothetical protein